MVAITLQCTFAVSPKTSVPKEMVNVKVVNIVTNKNEAKTMTKHILYGSKYKFNSTTCNSNQKWKNKAC